MEIAVEPAVAPGHRIAFNLAGRMPVEPSFASIEPLSEGEGNKEK